MPTDKLSSGADAGAWRDGKSVSPTFGELGAPFNKNAHLDNKGKRTPKKGKAAEERNFYQNWTLIVDSSDGASTVCPDSDSDSVSEFGASTLAGFGEHEAEQMGYTAWKKGETAFAPTITRSLSHRAKRRVPHLLSQNGITFCSRGISYSY